MSALWRAVRCFFFHARTYRVHDRYATLVFRVECATCGRTWTEAPPR